MCMDVGKCLHLKFEVAILLMMVAKVVFVIISLQTWSLYINAIADGSLSCCGSKNTKEGGKVKIS